MERAAPSAPFTSRSEILASPKRMSPIRATHVKCLRSNNVPVERPRGNRE